MSIRKAIHSKRYFFRIYILVSAIAITFIICLSSAIYFFVGNNLEKNEISNSKKVLVQMKNNVENIDKIVRNDCITNFYNSDVTSLMFQKEDPNVLDLDIMNKLSKSVIGSNSFIHSIYIYNNNRKLYYSTYGSVEYKDNLLEEVIKSYKKVPVLKPVLRSMEVKDVNGINEVEKMITYFFYEQTDVNNMMDGAIIFNVRLDWLFNNIKEVNSVEKKNSDIILLMDQKGEFINYNDVNTNFIDELKSTFKNRSSEMKNEEDYIGSYTQVIKGSKFLVTYVNLQNSGWVLFKAQLYSDIYRSLDTLKTVMIILAIIFILSALLVSLLFSNSIYRPVADILKEVKSERSNKLCLQNEKDEITLIKDTITISMQKLDSMQMQMTTNRQLMKTFFLKRLLTESENMREEDVTKGYEEHNLTLSVKDRYLVCIFKINNYKAFLSKYKGSDRELFKFAIMNIVSEIIAKEYRNETMDMGENKIAVLLGMLQDDKDFYTKIEKLIKVALEQVINFCEVSFFASVGAITYSKSDISKAYNEMLKCSRYRYIFGLELIITPDMISQNSLNTIPKYSFEGEKKFLDLAKKGDVRKAEEKLSELINSIKKMNYPDITIYTLHLVNAFKNLICDINQDRKEPIDIAMSLSNEGISEFETIEELKSRISEILNQLDVKEVNDTNQKQKVLTETIKNIISTNYRDSNLGAASIAGMLKMSPAYIGRVFNMNVKMTIPEYINELRMAKALEWLNNSKLSINDIMLKVGIENQSYFYKLFKSKYNTTPREYLQRIGDN